MIRLAFLTLLWACAQGTVMQLGSYNWALVATDGERVNISCKLPEIGNDTVKVVHGWTAPDGSDVTSGDEEDGQVLLNNQETLHLEIQESNYGVYTCHFETTAGDQKWHKHAVNLSGRFYVDPLDRYYWNIVAGSAAAGGVLAVCLLGCMVHKFRYKKRDFFSSDDVNLDQYLSTEDKLDEPASSNGIELTENKTDETGVDNKGADL